MKRLFKISFDQALLSLTPILSWFLLSLIIDKNLINVFTITYPLQCIYGIVRSPFTTGANISRLKDHNKNAVMSGLVIGSVLSAILYGIVIINIDAYLNFMHAEPEIYRTFCIYAIIILLVQTTFSSILDKLYFEDQNDRANRYSIAFNLLNFTTVIGFALFTKNQLITVSLTALVMTIFTLYVVLRNVHKFTFKLNILKCIKYDSAELVSYTTSFFVFLFGLSNAMDFGPQYALAITFTSLVTDTQWDILESIKTLAKIDISKHRFSLKKTLINAYLLLAMLLASSTLMFFCLYRFYNLDFSLALIYLALEFTDFLSCPYYYINTIFLQLQWSSSKTALNKLTARTLRLGCAFLPTPFCNNIGALVSTYYQNFTFHYLLHRYFSINQDGHIRKRRRIRKATTSYAYDDIRIEK